MSATIIRTFAEYEEGFSVGEESWLGLKQLAELTKVVVTNFWKTVGFQCLKKVIDDNPGGRMAT